MKRKYKSIGIKCLLPQQAKIKKCEVPPRLRFGVGLEPGLGFGLVLGLGLGLGPGLGLELPLHGDKHVKYTP